MEIDENIDKTELVKIIRSLVTFIVIDAKDYVKDELKEKYVKKYILTLTKSMNGQNGFVNVENLSKIVKKDASDIYKREQAKKKRKLKRKQKKQRKKLE